ncbi:MAG: type IV toxin-antitoxin system AbiEi family antitoxin domain-containing protein, partial [Dysgonamonadaceae bacterium]|nr:type IV toxin-antitoxin system AbiEi family antitoxin domain-containing protein [Dysgonamonadaceae bacterium]
MDALSGIKVISELTKYQWGLFTFAQALVKGVSRMNISRLLQHGHIEKIRHGV